MDKDVKQPCQLHSHLTKETDRHRQSERERKKKEKKKTQGKGPERKGWNEKIWI